MDKKYEELEIEVIEIDVEDVVTESNTCSLNKNTTPLECVNVDN